MTSGLVAAVVDAGCGVPEEVDDSGPVDTVRVSPIRVLLSRERELVRVGRNEYESDEYEVFSYVFVEICGCSFQRRYGGSRDERDSAVALADRVADALGTTVSDYGGVR